MIARLILPVVLLLSACTQSGQVFVPVNNAAITSSGPAPTYSLTLNIDLSVLINAPNNIALGTQAFSVLLFQNGTLMAAQYNSGATTSATGAATLVLQGVSATNCPSGTDAALSAGSYDLYFAIAVSGQTVDTVKPSTCAGGNGWIQSSMNGGSAGNLYGTKASINITGNTTYAINNLNVVQFRQHTFSLTAGFANYQCVVADINSTSYSTTLQPLAVFSRAADGSTTGGAALYNLLPVGTYKYFCSGSANATHFETGTDSGANGSLTVSGIGITSLAGTDFTGL